jgi:hypothetical protein
MLAPPAADASMEDNIRYLTKFAVESQRQSKITNDLLIANQAKIEATDSKVITLQAEVKHLKEIVNSNEQQKKSLSLRLLGLPPSEEELNGPDANAATAKLAYEKIIRPILTSAKAKGKIASVPSLANTISKAFRTAKLSTSSPNVTPPIIITVISQNVKIAILTNKKGNIPVPSPPSTGPRISLNEDLTADTFSLLKSLREDKRVGRVWSVDGNLKYILANDSENVIHRVKSIYDTVDMILSPVEPSPNPPSRRGAHS